MLKSKRQNIFINHGKLRFSSASATTPVKEASISSQFNVNNHSNEPNSSTQESQSSFLLYFHPKRFITLLLSCRNLFQIRQVHGHIASSGAFRNLAIANKLLFLYAQYGALEDAHELFDEMTERDPYSWSVIVGGYAKVKDFSSCFSMFRELVRCGMPLDNYTLPIVIRACRDLKDLQFGRVIHCATSKCGLDFDHFVCASLVDMYARCKVIEDARQLFDKMPRRDLVTWTVMVGALAECSSAVESLTLFDRMRVEGIVPDKVALVTVVYACAKLGAMNKARAIHDYINGTRFCLDVILGTAMIDMYAKCGSVDLAREIFDQMQMKNVITWSAMIAAYGYHGQGGKALKLFPMMLSSGILPNRITFVSLLYACSHAGLIEEGQRFFASMWDEYGVRPDVKHYTCMVDLLGRAGRFDEALGLIESMTVEKDEGLWGALLGACRIHRRLDLAKRVASSLLELQPQNPGHYVLLSNIYANAGKWEDMAKTRDLMTKCGLKKIPGWTWIEVDEKLYQFSVGDKTHPRSSEIYVMLKRVDEKLELAGYVPDTNYVLHDVDEEVKQGLLYAHSEKLAIAFGLIVIPGDTPIRITKNLRVCGDCHTFCKFVSSIERRTIILRDANRFHHFKEGGCSCRDYW
ncbi:pentatricopeptide repeat-containing protein At2g33760-like isoform X1 [Cucurbita maxima]|uniref:Pentatricopeptide repeat-containing protein At2g33760-like isoform X1 n=2 Tax=Cucurbita maxima TaxID=3661 RepID=A0A6J1KYT5_CUCMA|nr:pentatricopeptide repeat-containing protein At2g33760-like isoform X1 [Cucurbita maxima]